MDVTQRCNFECFYIMRVFNGNNTEYQLNCHNYLFEATVKSISNIDIAIPFEDLKDCMKTVVPSNSYVYYRNDTYEPILDIKSNLDALGIKSYPLDNFPCAESLLGFMTQWLQSVLDKKYPGLLVLETRLRESSDSYVTCKRKGGN